MEKEEKVQRENIAIWWSEVPEEKNYAIQDHQLKHWLGKRQLIWKSIFKFWGKMKGHLFSL